MEYNVDDNDYKLKKLMVAFDEIARAIYQTLEMKKSLSIR